MKHLLLAAVMIAPSAFAQAISVRTWNNPACATGACEISALKLHIRKSNDSNGAGNQTAIEVVATDKAHLKKYGVVQYIKGCVFGSSPLGQNVLATRNFGGNVAVPFIHRGWEIDYGDDTDPVYASYNEAGFDPLRNYYVPRNAGWLLRNPLIAERNNLWAGQEARVSSSNSIFADDFPQLAMVFTDAEGQRRAGNTSLQFKVCLYEMSKIPVSVTDPKTEIADPITCLEWSSNYVYSWSSRRYNEQAQVHPFCTQAR
jgi:hypothetical protein